jgi:hypothetical protein
MTDDELAYTAAGVPTWQHHLIHGEPMTQQQGRHPFEKFADTYIEDWTESALCSQVDPDLWFPEKNGHPYGKVRATCAACPVQPECAARALRGREHFGYWAGVNASAGSHDVVMAKWAAIAAKKVA